CDAESQDIGQCSPGVNRVTQNRHHRSYGLEAGMDSSHPEEPPEQSHTVTSDLHLNSGERRKRHRQQRGHTGEGPYSCSECGQCFPGKGSLHRHQKLHMGEGPYSCSKCGKGFIEKFHSKIKPSKSPENSLECASLFMFRVREMFFCGNSNAAYTRSDFFRRMLAQTCLAYTRSHKVVGKSDHSERVLTRFSERCLARRAGFKPLGCAVPHLARVFFPSSSGLLPSFFLRFLPPSSSSSGSSSDPLLLAPSGLLCIDNMTTPKKIEDDGNHITEKILNLTLEIIYLFIGEDYEVVRKTFGGELIPIICPLGPFPLPLPTSPLATSESNDKKILEVIQKIIELLTGEVPIRCQDVTVYFSMKEWEYLEGHKDLYKDVMMENQRTFSHGHIIKKPYHLSKVILNHTLEVINLLTGEVKMILGLYNHITYLC
ncbi:hypothetical protein AB205_0132160, partial [Aquarana catesbeiana]